MNTEHNTPKPLTEDELGHLLIVHLRGHRSLDKEMDDAMEAVRGIRKRRNRLRATIKTDGFLLKYVDEVLDDEKRARHEADADAINRTFIRRIARQPVTGTDDDQLDMFAGETTNGSPSLDKDDAHWSGVAYAVALRGGDVSPATNQVPPERLQAWEQGLAAGYSQFDIAQKSAAEIEKRRETT